MFEIVASLLALASLTLSAALAVRVRRLEEQLRSVERSAPTPVALPEPVSVHPLEGLRFALAISQDQAHAVFANLLKEHLLAEDAGEVALLAEGETPDWGGCDLFISGKVVCNGYAEIYYEADLTCHGPRGAICAVVERPPHGDRPVNLAVELIAKLKAELEKLERRDERRRALRELSQ
ncbi:MAG TPA: hypothetical protein VG820_11975 [Fimbriimonadaceae bacterium]|nr:hypothetical protein [Fimbriimonadaceae bacterium]